MHCWGGGAANTASSGKVGGVPVTKVILFYNGETHRYSRMRCRSGAAHRPEGEARARVPTGPVRLLSGFNYGKVKACFLSRGYRQGVEVNQVNPAFSSVIGRVKFMER